MSRLLRKKWDKRITERKAPRKKVEPTLSDISKAEDKPISPTYTKTDIMRMSKTDLAKLASERGMVGADEMSGNALKNALVNKLGL